MTLPWLRGSLLILCLILLPLSASLAAPEDAPSEAELAAIEAQKAEEKSAIEAKKKATAAKLNEARKVKRNVLGELNAIDNDLIHARSRLSALESNLAHQQEELARVRAQHERYQMEYAAAQRRLGNRLRTWYKSQHAPLVTLFFTSEGINDLSYRLRYAEAALSADRATIQFIEDQRELLERSDSTMGDELSRTQEIAQQVDAERASFQQLRNAKAEVLNDVSADVRKLERAYADLEQSSREIEWFLASLRTGGSPTFGGTFTWPLPGHTRISSGFGYRNHPILRKRKMHTGLDIPAPAGTPIRAAAAGTVVFVGWKNGYGKTVIVNHGKGFATLYAHMSSFKVREGQEVIQGATLGGCGQTGLATGNHLHFEVRVDGKCMNPKQYV